MIGDAIGLRDIALRETGTRFLPQSSLRDFAGDYSQRPGELPRQGGQTEGKPSAYLQPVGSAVLAFDVPRGTVLNESFFVDGVPPEG